MADEQLDHKKLTGKQERFCEEYLIDLNATQAAIRAGYSVDTAAEIGSENLRKPLVAKKICELKALIRQKNEGLAQEVIDELKKVGFSNIQNYIGTGNSILDISGIDTLKAAAVSSIKKSVTSFGDGEGNEGTKEVVELKMWDKISALEKIGRHLGIFEADNSQKSSVIKVRITDDDSDGD